MAQGRRKRIRDNIAALVLYYANRTCCVCRRDKKRLQIHHIDGNPNNSEFENLVVLCLDCHDESMIRGGVGRGLSKNEIVLSRDSWYEEVGRYSNKSATKMDEKKEDKHGRKREIIEVFIKEYLRNKDYSRAAYAYNRLGSKRMRDKYVELGMNSPQGDEEICELRAMQGRMDLVPKAAMKRIKSKYGNMGNRDSARFLADIGMHRWAIEDYIEHLHQFARINDFSMAYHLKEIVEKGLIENLFVRALEQAKRKRDVFWQIRALEELGRKKEMNKLLLKNARTIENGDDLYLQCRLALAQGNEKKWMSLRTMKFLQDYYGVRGKSAESNATKKGRKG